MWRPAILFLISGVACFTIPALDKESKNPVECTNSDCLEFANELVDGLNHSVNPCDNFFEYVCGGWNKRYPAQTMQSFGIMLQQMMMVNEKIKGLLQTEPEEGEDAFNKARHAYKTCMEYQEGTIAQQVREVTKKLGGWPLIEGAGWSSQHFYPSVSEVLPVLAKLRLINPQISLFSVGVIPNMEDVNNPKLALGAPNFNGLPIPPLMNQQKRMTVMAQLMQMAKIFNPEVNDQETAQDIYNMFKLNDILYSFVIQSHAAKTDPRFQKTEYTIEELEMVTKVEWSEFFSALLEGIIEVTPETKISVDPTPMYYLYQVFRMISEPTFDARALINYEILGIVNQLVQISSVLGQGKGSIDLNTFFSPPRKPENFVNLTRAAGVDKSAVCTQLLSQSYGYAIAWKYAVKFDDIEKQREVAKEITENIFHVFGERLKQHDWIDATSLSAAEAKIGNMKGHYIYPDWNEHLESVNEFYSDMSNEDNFIQEFINNQQFVLRHDLKEYAKVTKLLKWVMPPLITNAYYFQLDNAMRILDGIMQKPMFNPNRNRAMNYGSLGSIIGHEITHGFDQNGVKFDLNGKFNPWMSEASLNNFVKRAQCFKDQYSKYILTPEDIPGSQDYHVDGVKTADENIADNGGLQQAYYAYLKTVEKYGPEVLPDVLKQFSPEQVFFMSYAHSWCTNYGTNPQWSLTFDQDVHCVNKFRVIGTLSNFDEFHKRFGCFKGDKMVNDEQCKIW